jgi:hypothetical protein
VAVGDLCPQLFLREVAEILHQHSGRRRRADGGEGLDRRQALRLLAALHHLVEVGNRNLVAE